jgi:glycosyltransferase involved in cell wall biosynthesis
MKPMIRSRTNAEEEVRTVETASSHTVSKLSLCMIVKNEEERLASCLESVQGLVNEIVIVDTGSSDGTVDIATRLGAQVFLHPWKDDFGEARNEAVRHARGEWILQLDADETLDPEDRSGVRHAIRSEQIAGYLVILLSEGPDRALYKHRSVRLFRREGVQYRGRVHERPMVAGPLGLASVRIHHFGYDADPSRMAQKFERNERLLLMEKKDHPVDGFVRANLVRHYRIIRAWSRAVEEGGSTLASCRLSRFEEQMVLNDVMYSCFALNRLEEAAEAGTRGLETNPFHLDMLFVMGGVMVRQKRLEEALEYFRAYLEARKADREMPGLEGLMMDTYGFQGRAWNNIAGCLQDLGRRSEAIEAYEWAIRYEPRNAQFYKNLAGLCIRMGCSDLVLRMLEDADRSGVEGIRGLLEGMCRMHETSDMD